MEEIRGKNMKGKIYFVPTPIGNLKDITLRALEVLNSVNCIACEDTRQSLKLLNHFNIKKPLISYHKFNENNKSQEIINKVLEGESLAVVTDAGTPGVSDPGFVLVKECLNNDVPFEVLPGATAITTALLYSGLSMVSFTFIGFLPRERKERNAKLKELDSREETLIFYEAPHRIKETLKALYDAFGNRKISICRELTKLHEEIKRENLSDAIKLYEENNPKGELVLIVEGADPMQAQIENQKKWEDLSIQEHVMLYIKAGTDKKEAIKQVAIERGIPKKEVYKEVINMKE